MALAAALYTTVGHAGASAYIALMALFGIAPEVMRPTALTLNVLVASFTSYFYLRAGFFKWRTLWPFLIGAVPLAFIGGATPVPGHLYKVLVGAVLLIASARLLWPKDMQSVLEPRQPPIAWGIVAGAGIGLLAGLTGTGGGIFLSPLLLFLGWSDVRTASGVVALFILCVSIAGLAGNYTIVQSLPAELPIYAVAVLGGALVGTTLGIRLPSPAILKALGVVLLIAGLKLIGVY